MAKENVVLIGFMGSGKTVIGRQTARLLGHQFVDTDTEIQQVTGMTLAMLLKKHGEIRFRSEEELVAKKLASRRNLVIAAGGNLMPGMGPLNLLKEGGWFVLLQAEPDVLLERINRKSNRGNRPLLSGKPSLDQVRELLHCRERQYLELADFAINTTDIGVEAAADIIVEHYRKEREGNGRADH
jgi:shikimate kinase